MHESAPAVFDFEIEENQEVNKKQFEAILVAEGLDFGAGSISGRDDPEALHRTREVIENSDEILVAVDRDEHGRVLEDDGCGDGRRTKMVFRLKKLFKRSLNRAKVFGGAVAMTASGLIGTGRVVGRTLDETFSISVDELEAHGMDFGAHTDDQASGENCGCGAIDKAPKIVEAALKYETQIRGVIDMLGVDSTELDSVYTNYRDYAEAMPAGKPYSGRRIMDKIINAGKVVKQLAGKHREKSIVLNTFRDHTVNQELIRRETAGRADIFVVDIWRLEDIANGVFPDDNTAAARAYLSELIYTLATAAVLTKGDLPVYMIRAS